MLHVTIALHKSLNGPLTGTGAMDAAGAGAMMTLEVDFQIAGQEGTHHMSMPIGGMDILQILYTISHARVICGWCIVLASTVSWKRGFCFVSFVAPSDVLLLRYYTVRSISRKCSISEELV